MFSTSSISTTAASCRVDHATAVDEAFADLSDLAVRVDEAQPTASTGHYAAEAERLASRISQQLQAIDQQRHRLVQLLRGLEIPAEGKPSSDRK